MINGAQSLFVVQMLNDDDNAPDRDHEQQLTIPKSVK